MNNFDYNSIRAKKARVSIIAKSAALRVLIILITLSMIFGGLAIILLTRNTIGWILVGFSSPLIMLLYWSKVELIHVKNGKDRDINSLLSTTCLKLMPKDPTPSLVAKFVAKTRSGSFVLSRLEITDELLHQIAAEVSDMEGVFARAVEICEIARSDQIGGGTLVAAIIECHPECDKILQKLRITHEDLYETIVWFNHIHGLVKDAKKPRHTGGIGRDLAFGYTPLLQQFATNISQQRQNQPRTQIPQGNHTEIIEKMIAIFSKKGAQNVAIVGPNGTGRTTLVYAFAETLLDADSKVPSNLKFRQVFSLDASALISKAGARGELESLTAKIINEAFAARNVILCLDNAHLFFEEGVGSVDISKVLTPILEAGKMRIILVMDEQKYLEIAAKNSTLANSLNKLVVPVPDKETTLKVLEDQTPLMEYQQNVLYTYRSLNEAYELSSRYIHDIEMPGKAKQLLASAAHYAKNGIVTAESVNEAIEKTQGVKTQAAQSEEDKKRLLNLESLIHERMIDQTMAVKAVSDTLRRAAAGVRNVNRPIGTFLFLGPTGVGKTELAKAISEVYFRGEKHIVRLDLNEYVTEEDVKRLIATATENDASLVAQVSKRPFSVVLLDEIEKAHPKVLTTLLQLLDEGILRDAENHEISFRDTIVIATSNAAADVIREIVESEQSIIDSKEKIIDTLIKNNEFRPEFLNRFDEICLFKPLSKDDLIKILDLIMKSVNKNLDGQKITVRLDDSAKELLIEKGYDPKMGARPMKRIVQKTVENIVAKNVLRNEVGAGSEVMVTGEMIGQELES